jgi:hypothetical protein
VAALLQRLPPLAVHGYFVVTLAAYALGLFFTLRPRGAASAELQE